MKLCRTTERSGWSGQASSFKLKGDCQIQEREETVKELESITTPTHDKPIGRGRYSRSEMSRLLILNPNASIVSSTSLFTR